MGLFGKGRDPSQWPTAIASIDEIAVHPEEGKRVDISGAYTVNGEYFSVLVTRDFNSTRDAAAWAALMERTRTVTVPYKPDHPSDNAMEDIPSGR